MIDNDFKPTIHPKIIKGNEIFIDYEVLVKKIRNLETLIEDNNVEKIIKQLENIVEVYKPAKRYIRCFLYCRKTLTFMKYKFF